MNFSIIFSLIKTSATTQAQPSFALKRFLEKYSSSFAESHLMDFTVASYLMARKEREEEGGKNKTKSSLMTKEI